MANAGLASDRLARSLEAEYESNPRGAGGHFVPILDWLTARQRISEYQRQVLALGVDGPFLFDDYVIQCRCETGPLAGSFLAIQRKTRHPVRLFFCGGSDRNAAICWQETARMASQWSSIRSPFVWRVFEAVVAGDYRFVVTSEARGTTMAEKVPPKARLPWLQACQSIEQIALGLQAVHGQGLAHGLLDPSRIGLQKTGACQIIPPLPLDLTKAADTTADRQSGRPSRYVTPRLKNAPEQSVPGNDLFSLGQIAVRLITGKVKRYRATDLAQRSVELAPLSSLLGRYHVPQDLIELIGGLLIADVALDRPPITSVVDSLKELLAGQSTADEVQPEGNSIAGFQEWLDRRQAGRERTRANETGPDDTAVTGTPTFKSEVNRFGNPQEAFSIDLTGVSAGSSVVSASARVARRQRLATRRRMLPWLIGSSILGTAVVAGLLLSGFRASPATDGNRTVGKNLSDPGAPPRSEKNDSAADAANDHLASSGGSATQPANNGLAVGPATSVWLEQKIVDDPQIPWESPTAGAPLDVSRIPAAPEFLFSWHPARMVGDEQSLRMIRALGPEFQKLIDQWTAVTGIPLEQVGHMLVTLHAAQGKYDVFVHAGLVQPAGKQSFLDANQSLAPVATAADGLELFRGDNVSFGLLLDPADSGKMTGLMLGSGTTIEDSLASGGLAACDRYLADLISRSDQDRDANVLFLNSALLSQEGGWLFAGRFAGVRRPLQLFFEEHVRAVLLSLHGDRGSYLELMVEHSVDRNDDESAADLQQRLAGVGPQLGGELAHVTEHPYWTRLQSRFAPMIAELIRQTRVGKETDGVIANCWLPPAALHNLIAASELSISLGDVEHRSVAQGTLPQTLAELLETRRSLKVTNSPDLRILLEDLQNEVRDDFPDLPFAFSIRLRGDDLQLDGITQNQRPGSIDLIDKTLSEILTRIMVQANPDKDATGPHDPRCKLVWVATADPDDPQKQAVLITTRRAAAASQYELPAAFRAAGE